MELERRLTIELAVLRQSFGETFRYQPAQRGVVGSITTNAGRPCYLWLDLQFFPDNYPRVFVVAPRLLTFSGAPLSPMRHDMHTNEPDPHGNPQICHSGATAWSPATSLTAVVLKCRIWLEAYEAHLRTGRTIAELLPSQAQVAPPRAAGGSGR